MARFLVDKSAIARGRLSPEAEEVLRPLLTAGDVATCGMIDLELLHSATSPAAYAGITGFLRALPRVRMTEAIFDRALDVQADLAERSQHRGVSLPDLLVAAAAESAGLTVLHYDADYDRISDLTGQPTRWVVPRGSVD